MNFSIIPVTPFEQNCTLIWCEETGKAAVVDPGGDLERIQAEIERRGLALEKILITHAHIDHAGGAGRLARIAGVPIEGPHKDDLFWIEGMLEQSRSYGVTLDEPLKTAQSGSHILREAVDTRHILNLVLADRIDYTIEYPLVVEYLIKKHMTD